MTGDEGVVRRPAVLQNRAAENAGVGAADGNRFDFHKHLAVARLRNRDGLDGEIARRVQHGGAHGFVHGMSSVSRWDGRPP